MDLLPRLSRRRLAAAWAGVAAVSAAAGFAGHRAAEERLLGRVREQAAAAASSFLPADIAEIEAGPAGGAPAAASAAGVLRRERLRLVRLRDADPAVLAAAVLERGSGGGPPGTLFEAAGEPGPGAPYLAGAVPAAAAAASGPVAPGSSGPFGEGGMEWAVGYAGIGGRAVAVLAVSAAGARSAAALAAFRDAASVLVLLGLPLAAIPLLRSVRERADAIHNLSEAMDQSHSAVMITDTDSRIEYANASLCRQIGYSRRDLLGRPWRDFQHPNTPPGTIADLVTTVRSGRPWRGVWYNRRKDGGSWRVSGTVTPVKAHDGRIVSFVSVFEEVVDGGAGRPGGSVLER